MKAGVSSDFAIRMLPGTEVLSREDFQKRAAQFARLLQSRKVERVAFLTEHRLECAELVMGAHMAGVEYTISGTDRLATGVRLPRQALKEILEVFDPTMVVISDTYSEIATWLADEIPKLQYRLMVGQSTSGWEDYAILRDQQPGGPFKPVRAGKFYPLSGGSTGRPKVIKPSQRLDGTPYPLQTLMNPGKNGVVLVTGSVFANLGARTLLGGLVSGAQVILLKHWDPHVFLEAIDTYKVTHTTIAPTRMVTLLQMPTVERLRYDVTSLKQLLHTGAACSNEVKRQFVDWLGDRVVEVYGTAERFGATSIKGLEWLKHPGSVGLPLPGCRVIIRDQSGKGVPKGEKGIIWFVQDSNQSKAEYLGNPEESLLCYNSHGEATARDIGYLDEEGYLFVTGRDKRMVVVGGMNVYPEVTEKFIGSYLDVSDVWVFGAPDASLGERLHAFVQLKPGLESDRSVLAKGILNSCENELGVYATPSKVNFVDQLPRNEAGKIDAQQIARMEKSFREEVKASGSY